MPLIACPECETQISNQAAACPKCGHPVTRPDSEPQPTTTTRSGASAEAFGFGIIVVGLFLAFAVNGTVGGILMAGGFVVFLSGRFS